MTVQDLIGRLKQVSGNLTVEAWDAEECEWKTNVEEYLRVVLSLDEIKEKE